MSFILQASDANAANQLGGKAGALAALAPKKLPIPGWFVVTPTAFDRSLADRGLADHSLIEAERSPLTPTEVRTALDNLHLSESVQAELRTALAALCPKGERVAVRSSAIDEDGAQHSFAGQLDSFLFVEPQDVAKRIVDVWRSGFSDRLLVYRQENQLDLPTAPAVLVQVMVDAQVSGVAFSANPVTGQRAIALVSAVYGLGTALVSGEVDADSYQVNRAGEIVSQQIAEKRSAHRYVPDRQEIASVEVDSVLVQQPVLTDEQVRAIANLARQVEAHFGRPQDIEWAIDPSGKLYLLQARPITALAQMPDPDGVLNLWDNSNIAESYGGVTTPLTFSFARRAYEEVYRQFCRIMSVPEGAIAQHDSTFRRMLGLVQGRIYYNLLSWYRVLALLPGFSVNRRLMEQMMGVREELPAEILTELTGANWKARLQDSFRLVSSIAGLLKNYFTLPQQIQRFYQRLERALNLSHLPAGLAEMRPDELATYYRSLERQLLTRWDAPLVNDFFAMIFYGVLRKLTTQWCSDTEGTLQNDLVSGEGGVISAEPAHRVQQLAAIATQDQTFVQLLCTGSLEQILPQIELIPAFHQPYQEYLQKFGDRCLEELKLESPTLYDDPLVLLRSVGQLAQSQTQSFPFQREFKELNATTSLRQQAEATVKQSLQGHPLRRLIFSWVLKNARERVRDRENLRFERTRLFGRTRQVFVELGKRFYGQDALSSPRDIFYLELNEILSFIDGTATCTDLKGLVALRQAEFARYRQLPAPGDRFETHGIVYQNSFHPKAAVKPASGDSLKGTGCCPGIVRAPVQVITDPRQATLRQGSILVAERTDPGWIMLFPAAAGLLVERGSLLSHSAIVAREMGIPAIVSIPQVTQWLKDGDWVEMDGSTGIVRRIAVEAIAQDYSQEITPSPNSSDSASPLVEVGNGQ
ncbi:phosphoenolpyruvate synthase [Leptolyngbya sp. FACHB-671]|uniref:PEP/pyruvate-binding domain-containing protein n=1 Tax=Leptolyngbya sp. FACHB-671 TaxID=2692812 RepID=UPI001686F85A|nr:PEP/pyruvate-binding domain-containing protein [Leptolyngbya sp. FACHB-671]MBD2071279.1 phosphoenolpyruvate synthase [Leptolyngbya sp. FACHB-671]